MKGRNAAKSNNGLNQSGNPRKQKRRKSAARGTTKTKSRQSLNAHARAEGRQRKCQPTISHSDAAPVFVGGRFDGFVFDSVVVSALPQHLHLPNGQLLHVYKLCENAGRRVYRHAAVVLRDGGGIG